MAKDNLFLKAGQHCIDIFENLDRLEIDDYPSPIIRAWEIGRELSAEIAEQKEVNDRVDTEIVV